MSERTAALEESKSTFQRLSELLQVGVHRSDIEGNIVWANRKWFQVLGIEQGTIDSRLAVDVARVCEERPSLISLQSLILATSCQTGLREYTRKTWTAREQPIEPL